LTCNFFHRTIFNFIAIEDTKNYPKSIDVNGYEHLLHKGLSIEQGDQTKRVDAFYQLLDSRRSVRHFSTKPVSKEIIETLKNSGYGSIWCQQTTLDFLCSFEC
jgi:hypothetical protein